VERTIIGCKPRIRTKVRGHKVQMLPRRNEVNMRSRQLWSNFSNLNADYSTQNLGYRTSTGTTLMLLNGEPLISFVLTTV
jgi:hypothetical protein